MKKTMRRILATTTLLAILLSTTVAAEAPDGYTADPDDPSSYTANNGSHSITVYNASSTGVDIENYKFFAYQIFIADDVTSYSVTDEFRGFFSGEKTDDSGANYNFAYYLNIINTYEDDYATNSQDIEKTSAYETALDSYNHLAGQYMDSYENNMYALAVEIRDYLDSNAWYKANDTGTIYAVAYATAAESADATYESAVLTGIDTGYYFVLSPDATMSGIGVAATGAFVPLTTSSESNTVLEVKDSIPTMTKQIYHDDAGKWDIVGDSQIGDTVSFRVISTLPSNIQDYIDGANVEYIYTLTDVMSDGLDYDEGSLAVYSDADKVNQIPSEYLTITDASATGFTLTVDVEKLLTEYDSTISTLYSFYTATLTEDALVIDEHDTNTATLVYSNNPATDATGTTDSTVTHFTFTLDVVKVDENLNPLAGATFGLFDEDGNAIPLEYTETVDGVDLYCYSTTVDVAEDGGYIVTSDTGKFQIYGLNDQVTYTLREVSAPNGYNTADQFDFYFIVTYDALGTSITHMTDGSGYVSTSADNGGNWSSTSTIINHLKIYLPTTGGVGTVLFRVGGGTLMLGAVYMLYVSHRKKEESETPTIL